MQNKDCQKLRECPFCGGKAVVDKHSFYNDKTKGFTDRSFGVKCYECFAQSYQFYQTEENAINAWNRRVDK